MKGFPGISILPPLAAALGALALFPRSADAAAISMQSPPIAVAREIQATFREPAIGVAPWGGSEAGRLGYAFVKEVEGKSRVFATIETAAGSGVFAAPVQVSNGRGDDRNPTLAVAPNGDLYIAWEGLDAASRKQIFYARLDKTLAILRGPIQITRGVYRDCEQPAIAGAEVRRATIATEPPDATVSIIDAAGDERLLTRSERVVYLYGPSERALVGRAPGREDLTLYLAGAGADERLFLSLKQVPSGPGLVLDSVPSGAAVYIEGIKAGVAPLEVAQAPFPRLAEFRLDGFRPAAFVLEPGKREAPLTRLVPESTVLPQTMDKRRDAFYESLGWFVVSLPISVLSWQVYRSYYDAALLAGESDPAYAGLSFAAGASGAAFAASAGISVGLAGFSAFRLWHYIRSAD